MAIGSSIKDEITTWFIKNVLVPKLELIDNPGFIITRYTDSIGEVYLREIVLPETLFVKLERAIVDAFKERGRQALYSAGKKFGFRYALASRLSVYNGSNKKQVENSVYRFVRYLETVYARQLVHKIDVKNRLFSLEMKDYIICSSNGIGLLTTDGALGGIMSFIFGDKSVEGVQSRCQGRGDEKCNILCAPATYLASNGIRFLKELDLENLELSKSYRSMNEIRKTNYAAYSLKDLVDSGFFKYSGGRVEYSGKRYFAIEASFLYLVEAELRKIGAADIAFDVAFDYGRQIAAASKNQSYQYVTDYISALGFGDILVTRKNKNFVVDLFFYPWTRFTHATDFSIIRGFLSGILSGITKTTVHLDSYKLVESENGFTLSLFQK